ncbi:hypothetical protein LEP1GSC132_2453 [Leptospira kirschneri str. 200803703]|uniref:Uncharacterized protein n=1 Tax=Leptospira kirschneri str. 200802841 TaxID=1193047 RepID=A0A828Y3P4_9LEPT|nr:hypothetical protein LEP1GSC131_3314 [Leptospira kirschneri str. 200802841]EMO67712.1 hypothetical protein LEP1GSC132_2453 [Leptospira kirschneri str. 200803703]EMO74419.1 hypothetical protein LEP1GSC127_3410 [Leptospira kirschneri str. 200801925]EPG48278.1 hypothetical protein LEP1GSC049_2583 [Leptospira kirschneri serovar Cynopteri str. 3522 CT]
MIYSFALLRIEFISIYTDHFSVLLYTHSFPYLDKDLILGKNLQSSDFNNSSEK